MFDYCFLETHFLVLFNGLVKNLVIEIQLVFLTDRFL